MDGEDFVGDRGGRIERSCRIGGVVLLIGAVLASFLNDFVLAPRQPGFLTLTYAYGIPARVLSPAGAMLLASSLSVRALVRPFRNPSARAQLVAGTALLIVGLFQLTVGPQVLPTVTDFLGATANAGVFLAESVARVTGLLALPLGIALLAVNPLVRLAQTMQAQAVAGRPPDAESLE